MNTVHKDTKKRKKILIGEDDKSISKALSQLLQNAHYATDQIIDGLKIILRVEKTLPDLLLLDVSMPGTDGRDICIELKKNNLVRHIPIIMMSAHADIQKMAIGAGADDFLAKPFNISDLLFKIEKCLVKK